VLQIHDELLLEAPEVEVPAIRQLVREEMIDAFPLEPALGVDVDVGRDWLSAKS
jgi:DNA polymerase I